MDILKGVDGLTAWLAYNKVVFALPYVKRFNVIATEQSALIEQLKDCETIEEYQEVAEKLHSDRFEKTFFPYRQAVEIFRNSSRADKIEMLLECLTINELSHDDQMALLRLHKDANGHPIGRSNIKSMNVMEILPAVMDTLMHCSELDVNFDLLTPQDLKDLQNARIDIRDSANEILSNSPEMETSSLIALAVKRVMTTLRAFNNGSKSTNS